MLKSIYWRFFFSWIVLCATYAVAQEDPIQKAIDAQQFSQAVRLIEEIPDADPWFGKLALAQLATGDREGARSSLRRIQDFGELSRATGAAAASNPAQGGATGADFDSLINLLTTSVEPDSWDVVGGPGTIVDFPGGIEVDARGILQKREAKQANRGLDLIRDRAQAEGRKSGGPSRESRLRMVSLPRLEREMLLRVALGEKPTDAMKHLAGIYELRYVFLFPETNDVVIAGPADSWRANEYGVSVTPKGRPVLLLEDLVALLRNYKDKNGKYGCSIDPKQESLARTRRFLQEPTGPLRPAQTRRWVQQIREQLGRQNVRVYGVDPSSHVAKVLVEADYHMKLVGMGLEPSPGDMTSYLDSITVENIPKSMDVLRWWFTMQANPMERNASRTAFQFSGKTVQLQSENERLTANGKRSHTGDSSQLNQAFVNRFNQHYDQLCHQYPIYRELQNLFRLSLLAGLLQQSEVASQVNWTGEWLLRGVKLSKGEVLKEVPSIVNHRVIKRKHVIVGVSGGVTVNVSQHLKSMKLHGDRSSVESAQMVSQKQIPLERWWWD